MKRTLLFCIGIVLMVAVLGLLTAVLVSTFSARGVSPCTLALCAMGVLIPFLIGFIHFTFKGAGKQKPDQTHPACESKDA